MNLNEPEVAPLANWCISALMCGVAVSYDLVPQELACTEEFFTAVIEEIIAQLENGKPTTVH
jgi:hypothetical protein